MLTKLQNDIIIGCLLGDGSISNDNRFNFSQKLSCKEYVEFIYEVLNPWSCKVEEVIYKANKSRKEFKGFRVRSVVDDIFANFRKQWYNNGVKILPPNLELNWQIIAHWHMQDGCNFQPKKFAIIASESFTNDENEKLVYLLSKLGINSNLNKRKLKTRIRIGVDSYYYFMEQIKPYIRNINCMHYKCSVDIAKQKSKLKLDIDKKEQIIDLWKSGKYSKSQIVLISGISKTSVLRIIKNTLVKTRV
jgi:hypothetical protein